MRGLCRVNGVVNGRRAFRYRTGTAVFERPSPVLFRSYSDYPVSTPLLKGAPTAEAPMMGAPLSPPLNLCGGSAMCASNH